MILIQGVFSELAIIYLNMLNDFAEFHSLIHLMTLFS